MQEPNHLDGEPMSDEIVQPRVFVRKMGGDYTEILGIQSFERNDHGSSGGEISFVMTGEQEDAVKKILLSPKDKFVDVKMEFLIDMLMVMTFSGSVEEFSGNAVCFAVSSPITTNVLESPENLH